MKELIYCLRKLQGQSKASFVVPNVWFIFLEPVYRNLFFFFLQERFPNFSGCHRRCFQNLETVCLQNVSFNLDFFEIFLSCFLCKIISYNLKHLYIKHLYICCNYFFYNLYVFNNHILWDQKAATGRFFWKKLSLKILQY